MRPLRAVSVVVGFALVAAGCGAHRFVSLAAPPLVVCGTTLSSSAAGAVSYDITRGAVPPIMEPTVDNAVYLIVSHDCRRGASVTASPSSAYTILRQALAYDGKLVAVALTPIRYVPVVVTARRGSRVVGSVLLDITAPALQCGGVTSPGSTTEPCQTPTSPKAYQVMVNFGPGPTPSDVAGAARCGQLAGGGGLTVDRGVPPHGVVAMAVGAALGSADAVRDCLSRVHGVQAAWVITLPWSPPRPNSPGSG